MVSAASGGPADRITPRILFKVLRAGSGTRARYSSIFFGAPLPFAAELRLPDFTFFMLAILREPPLQVHAPDRREAVRIFWFNNNCPLPPVFVGVASKELRVCVSGLESTLAGFLQVLHLRELGEGEFEGDRRGCGRSGA